jgi:hypothetical protein
LRALLRHGTDPRITLARSDPISLATLDVLTKLLPPALFSDANVGDLIPQMIGPVRCHELVEPIGFLRAALVTKSQPMQLDGLATKQMDERDGSGRMNDDYTIADRQLLRASRKNC